MDPALVGKGPGADIGLVGRRGLIDHLRDEAGRGR